MNNNEFLEKLKEAFYKYLETGSRSNEKLKILHGSIANDLKKHLSDEYQIHSLGYGNNKEIKVNGRYMAKKVDIAISKDNSVIASIALKFVMRNYSQNSNNYFENMLGETSNIRSSGKPYFQIIILPSKVPYFKKDGVISHFEVITENNLSKYINLSNDNINEFMHTPNKTLLYLVDMPQLSSNINNIADYIKYYQENNDFSITQNNGSYNFGNNVIFNNYEEFIEKVSHYILSI